MAAATLCGIKDTAKVTRSTCAMGHKWLWNESLGGLPSNDFLKEADPLLDGWRDKLQSPVDHRHPPTTSPDTSRRNGPYAWASSPASPSP